MRERRALGPAGRARRVDDREQVVFRERLLGEIGRPVGQLGERTPVARRPSSITKTCSSDGTRASRVARPRRCAARRQINTFASESFRPNSSSSAFHHAFSGTSTAPSSAQAQKVTTQSGLFAEHSATRSPTPTPRPASDAATARARRVVCAERQAVLGRVALHDEVEVGARRALRHQLAQRPHALAVDLRLARRARLRARSRTGRPGPVSSARTGSAPSRSRCVTRASAATSCCTTSNDHSSLPVPTGPPCACPACPCWNAWLFNQAWKSSSERHRVYTRNTSRSSLGRSSSKASKPGDFDTAPARFANRSTSWSARSAGTVMALILTTVMRSPSRAGRAFSRAPATCAEPAQASSSDWDRRNCSISATRSPVVPSCCSSIRSTTAFTSGRASRPASTRRRYASLRRRARAGRDRGGRSRPDVPSSARTAGGDGEPDTYCGTCTHSPAAGDADVAERAQHDGLQPGGAGVVGPHRCELLRQRPLRRRRGDDHRLAVRDQRRDAAQRRRLPHAEPARRVDRGRRDARPAQRRLRSAHQHDVTSGAFAAAADVSALERDARPIDHPGVALPARGRPRLLEIGDRGDVDRRERLGRPAAVRRAPPSRPRPRRPRRPSRRARRRATARAARANGRR